MYLHEGGEKKLKPTNRAYKYVQAAEVAVRTLPEYEPLRLGRSTHSPSAAPVESASRLRKLSVGLLESQKPVFSAGGGDNDSFDVTGGADDMGDGGLIVRSSSMSTSNSPRPSIDAGTRGAKMGLSGWLPAPPPPAAGAARHKQHGSTSVSSSVSKWANSSVFSFSLNEYFLECFQHPRPPRSQFTLVRCAINARRRQAQVRGVFGDHSKGE